MPAATAPPPAVDPAAAARRRQEFQNLQDASFPARCRRLLTECPIGHDVDEPLSDELAKAIADHRADVRSLLDILTKSLEQLAAAVADAEASDDFLAVLGAIDSINLDRSLVTQKTVRLWTKAVELATQRREELKPHITPAIDRVETVVAEIKDQLTKIGSGPEALDAWPKNQHAAARQFDYKARYENRRARAAIAAARLAQAQLDGATEAVRARERGLHEARKVLRAEAIRAVQA